MPSRASRFVLLALLAWAAVATSALPHQASRAIQQQQLSANDAAAVASHVKEPTVPACRVGDSACDPDDDVGGYCCPEGTITGGSSIEDNMINGKSVRKTVLKCIGTKRCAGDSDEDASKEAPPDVAPASTSEIEPCLAGDKACGDSETFSYATDNFGLAYGPKVDACCPQNTNRVQRLHNTAVRLTCQGAASSKCAGPKGALKKALKKKVDAKAAKKKKKAAEAAAEKAKAAAKALKEKAAADAQKAAQSKTAADAASKLASAKVAAAKSTAANQPTSAHAGYAGTSVIFSGPGCTGKAIKTTSFTEVSSVGRRNRPSPFALRPPLIAHRPYVHRTSTAGSLQPHWKPQCERKSKERCSSVTH